LGGESPAANSEKEFVMRVETEIHVFIEIDRHKQEKLLFDTAEVTGADIKAKGQVPPSDELFLRDGQKLVQIGDQQRITLKNGEHFVALPPGTVS
jgi:hypothetical protein